LIRLQQRPLLGLLVNPLGSAAKVLELEGHQLRVTKRGQTSSVSLGGMSSPPTVRGGLIGTTLTAQFGSSHDVVLKGAAGADALAFADGVKAAWVAFNMAALEREADRFDSVYATIVDLGQPARYPAACSIDLLLQNAKTLNAQLLSKLQPEAIGVEKTQRIRAVERFVGNPAGIRASAIEAFVAAELVRWGEFFDTIESKPVNGAKRCRAAFAPSRAFMTSRASIASSRR